MTEKFFWGQIFGISQFFMYKNPKTMQNVLKESPHFPNHNTVKEKINNF
jgi:hypothetical protein